MSDFIWLGFMGFGLFVLARNESVFRVRRAFIDCPGLGIDAYKVLPSYEEMMLDPRHYFRWTKAQWVAWVEAQP